MITKIVLSCLAFLSIQNSAFAIVWGVNGHDGRKTYPLTQTEAVFKLLDSKNLRSYRLDIGSNSDSMKVMDTLVPLAKKYNITLRPMLYLTDRQSAYQMAKRYVNDIKIWELGNELDTTDGSLAIQLQAMADGIKQAGAEAGVSLYVTLNFMENNFAYVDLMIANGLKFDYLSYHLYPRINYPVSGSYSFDSHFKELARFGKPVFLNETNCAEIYDGDDGTSPTCKESLRRFLSYINTQTFVDIREVNLYELFDQPDMSGAERFFGLMKNINTPKPIFDVLVEFSKPTTSLPDLVIVSVGMSPAQPRSGQKTTFYAIVKNQGTVATPVGRILGVTFAIDGVLRNWSNNNSTTLAPGASIQLISNSGSSGVATWTATRGKHSAKIEVNPDLSGFRFPESNLTNNNFSATFNIP